MSNSNPDSLHQGIRVTLTEDLEIANGERTMQK